MIVAVCECVPHSKHLLRYIYIVHRNLTLTSNMALKDYFQVQRESLFPLIWFFRYFFLRLKSEYEILSDSTYYTHNWMS